MVLGAAALAIYSPDVVAEAIHLALEAAAREADEQLTLSDDRETPVRIVLIRLHDAGILAEHEQRTPPAPTPLRTRKRKRDAAGQYALETTPSELAQQFVQAELLPLDAVLAASRCYVYTEHERPGARGLPVLSANGHPSSLSRIADPLEPGASTRAEVRSRRADHLHATALVEASTEAARRRNRRKARQEAIAA